MPKKIFTIEVEEEQLKDNIDKLCQEILNSGNSESLLLLCRLSGFLKNNIIDTKEIKLPEEMAEDWFEQNFEKSIKKEIKLSSKVVVIESSESKLSGLHVKYGMIGEVTWLSDCKIAEVCFQNNKYYAVKFENLKVIEENDEVL